MEANPSLAPLPRQQSCFSEVVALFQELGIDFISYKENIDTTTSMGRLIFHINSAYAEFEREIIRDRVIAGIKAKREKTGAWGRKKIQNDIQIKIQELTKWECPCGRSLKHFRYQRER